MLSTLRLQKVRSYKDELFVFEEGVNIIVGPNASGKTTILEGLLVSAQGKSFKARDNELIQFDQPWCRVDTKDEEGNERTVKVFADKQRKKTIEVDSKEYQRLSLAKTLPTVVFEPNHLQLLVGPPEARRTYLDDIIEQTAVDYGKTRRSYKRALAQRNALLKQRHNLKPEQLFPWNLRLGELAGQIVNQRTELIAKLNSHLSKTYKGISGSKTEIGIKYSSTIPASQYVSSLLKAFELNLDEDIRRGFTSNGPHREDFITLFDNHPVELVASRGENRTAVLAFKVLELNIIETERQKKPLLLLDDVFSELDGKRRRYLTDYLKGYQSFITTTDADVVIQHFTETTNIIPLS